MLEYQHRGLPHGNISIFININSLTSYFAIAHLVIAFTDMPVYENKLGLSAWVDENILATLPVIDEHSSQEDIRLEELARKNMTHKCENDLYNIYALYRYNY